MDVFKTTLQGIVDRVAGVMSAAVIGTDGIILENAGELDRGRLENIAAEFTAFAKSIKVSNTEIGSGDLEQFSVSTATETIILSAVTPEYYLLLLLSREGSFGRARFESVKAQAALEPELV